MSSMQLSLALIVNFAKQDLKMVVLLWNLLLNTSNPIFLRFAFSTD